MTTIKPSLVLAFLCLVLHVGSALASTSELLYVQEGKNIVTCSVNNTTAVTKKLGTLVTNYPPGIATVNRSGVFLYILGFSSATQEYFNVYSLTAAGVPMRSRFKR